MDAVCVLISTFNGEKYISEQIESILKQINVNVRIVIRDDGSSDKTLDVLKRYKDFDNIQIIEGKNIGYSASFLSLLKAAPHTEYYAFCDQDDYWEKEKLSKAIHMLKKESADNTLLYTSALKRTDEKLNVTNIQNFGNLKLDFYSEFVRHRFAGCTYVLNNKLRDAVLSTDVTDHMMCPHDTLVALLCWACGGRIVYDANSYILFRRHGSNTSIDGMGIKKRIKKEFYYFSKNKRDYKYKLAKFILDNYEKCLTDESKNFFNSFVQYKKNIHIKIRLLCMKKLDCGLMVANTLFKMGILLNRV